MRDSNNILLVPKLTACNNSKLTFLEDSPLAFTLGGYKCRQLGKLRISPAV